jgi:V/A-type H+-transporting ATPase subunit E
LTMAENKSVAEGIRALRREILSKAQSQAEDLTEEAKKEKEAARQQAEEKAQAIKEEILHSVQEEAASTKQQGVSAARLEAQRMLLARREELISQVFAEAQKRLTELRRSDAYPNVLRRLAVEAATGLGGGNLIVWANKEDTALLSDECLAQVAQGLDRETTLRRGESSVEIDGGVIVERADGHMRYDNSFAARLERSKDELRSEVYHVLTATS